MRAIDEFKEFVQSIINYHESNDFESLSGHILETEIEEGTWFTQKRFVEVCEIMEKQLGNITSLEFISTLNRKSSYVSLWKSAYSKSNDEVLWSIIFDRASDKIKLIHIYWEKI